MSVVTKLSDNYDLIPCDKFPSYAKFPYEKFNPVQSRVFDIYNQDANFLIAAKTSAGKTTIAEMLLSYEIRERGRKGMFLGPLRSLTKEKIDDWLKPGHHFSDLKIAICTGDYRLTAARKKELDEANLIIMTTELLGSRTRNFNSENNQWLRQVGTCVVDELHLLTVPVRGPNLEVAMMNFATINPDSRFVGLSATMPNVSEIADWMCQHLTHRDTFFLDSEFRPCPLGIHYEEYYDGAGSYADNEMEKMSAAMRIIEDHPKDKFLVFVHTKDTGRRMMKMLADCGYTTGFHNADLASKTRHKLEDDFKAGQIDVLVATSSLAWGVNLPARRVIILGVHRGMEDVEPYDVTQMVGRSGRVGLDPRGDAYILVPESRANYYIQRLKTPQPIRSRLLEFVGDGNDKKKCHYKILAFHLVAEIHHGRVKTREDVHNWYKKSLSCFQEKNLDETIVDIVLDSLLKIGCIRRDVNEYMEDVFETTALGNVASMFYFSPYDVSCLKKNFNFIFQHNATENDLAVSLALGNIDSYRFGIVNRAEREEMYKYHSKVRQIFGEEYTDAAIKAGYAYFALMNGQGDEATSALRASLRQNFPRVKAVLNSLDSMVCKWDQADWLQKLSLRVSYGVKGDMVYLCEIPNVGGVRAEKLWNSGLRTLKEIAENPVKVQTILGMSPATAGKICLSAKELMSKNFKQNHDFDELF